MTAANLLHPVPVPADRLLWIPAQRMFVTEISDIGGRFGQVWNDSCDEGLTLISRYPGKPDVVFAVDHEERDREGDIRYWDLVPADLAQRKTVPFTVRVYND